MGETDAPGDRCWSSGKRTKRKNLPPAKRPKRKPPTAPKQKKKPAKPNANRVNSISSSPKRNSIPTLSARKSRRTKRRIPPTKLRAVPLLSLPPALGRRTWRWMKMANRCPISITMMVSPSPLLLFHQGAKLTQPTRQRGEPPSSCGPRCPSCRPSCARQGTSIRRCPRQAQRRGRGS